MPRTSAYHDMMYASSGPQEGHGTQKGHGPQEAGAAPAASAASQEDGRGMFFYRPQLMEPIFLTRDAS